MATKQRASRVDKDPDENLDYSFDWNEDGWLDSGDTIDSSVWSTPTGLTEGSKSNDTTTTTVWLSGGTAGKRYPVVNRVTTAEGRIGEWTLLVNCKNSADILR